MSVISQFAALSANDQWMIRQLQAVGFGRLTFSVRSGCANPDYGFRTVHTRKLLGGDSARRPKLSLADFDLRAEHVALLSHIKSLPDGTTVTVKVALGLPTSTIDIEEEHCAA